MLKFPIFIVAVGCLSGFALELSKYQIPELLKGDADLQYVCHHSRQPWALVAMKAHACDALSLKGCMNVTRNLSDPCNPYLKNFSLFHFRIGRYPGFESGSFQIIPRGQKQKDLWDDVLHSAGLESGDGTTIVDVTNCRVISHPYLPGQPNGTRYERAKETNRVLATALVGLFEADSALDPSAFKGCESAHPEPNLRTIWDMMEAQ